MYPIGDIYRGLYGLRQRDLRPVTRKDCSYHGRHSFAGDPLVAAAQEDLTKTFVYLGVAAVFFVLISLIPTKIRKRNQRQNP